MSTHNIGFYEDLTKLHKNLSLNYHQISSNTHLISSAGQVFFMWLIFPFSDKNPSYLHL